MAGTAAAERAVSEARRQGALVVGGLSTVVGLPLVIALAVLRDPPWLALSDMALIEMRVRDVGLAHPPLVGLPGRVYGFGSYGSHPGPLSFYALAPFYRLFGADSWALLAASATAAFGAVLLAIWIGYRRGGWRLALAIAGMFALLLRAYGLWRVVHPWNPDLPLVWWLVFLLAVWAVWCDDLRMLPVAALAGTYCAQTHVPFVGLVAGLLAPTAAWLGWRWFNAKGDENQRRRLARWVAFGAGLAALPWLPPLYEQLTRHPGNIAILVENFRVPYGPQVSFGDAVDTWLRHLDVGALLGSGRGRDHWHPRGSKSAGALWLVAWSVSAGVSVWRGRGRGLGFGGSLARLHLLVGAATVLGLVAMSRIFGELWPYLTQWAWGTIALMGLALVWTALARFDPNDSTGRLVAGLRWPGPATVGLGLGLATLVLVGLLGIDSARTEMPSPAIWQQMATLSEATVPALEDDPVSCGDDCHYLVTWNDPVHLGAQGYGMLLELERQGYDVGAAPPLGHDVRGHRVLQPEEADAEVHVAVGLPAIDAARLRSGTEELVYIDQSTTPGQPSAQDLEDELIRELEAEGHEDLVQEVDSGFVTSPQDVSEGLSTLIYIWNGRDQPAAVFLVDPEAP